MNFNKKDSLSSILYFFSFLGSLNNFSSYATSTAHTAQSIHPGNTSKLLGNIFIGLIAAPFLVTHTATYITKNKRVLRKAKCLENIIDNPDDEAKTTLLDNSDEETKQNRCNKKYYKKESDKISSIYKMLVQYFSFARYWAAAGEWIGIPTLPSQIGCYILFTVGLYFNYKAEYYSLNEHRENKQENDNNQEDNNNNSNGCIQNILEKCMQQKTIQKIQTRTKASMKSILFIDTLRKAMLEAGWISTTIGSLNIGVNLWPGLVTLLLLGTVFYLIEASSYDKKITSHTHITTGMKESKIIDAKPNQYCTNLKPYKFICAVGAASLKTLTGSLTLYHMLRKMSLNEKASTVIAGINSLAFFSQIGFYYGDAEQKSKQSAQSLSLL